MRFLSAYKLSGAVFLTLLILILLVNSGRAQLVKESDENLSRIDVEEHLGDFVPLDLKFLNSTGAEVVLGDYFGGEKPLILVLAYYECPMLCNLVLNGLSDGIRQLGWQPGEKYRIVTISFDSSETWELAAAKKRNYMQAAQIDPEQTEIGWDFLVTTDNQARRLADAVGFRYFYDEKQKQFAHPAVLYLLSPEGRISRYLYGIEFNAKDLRLGILEASEGKVGNTIDKILLYCYQYDPNAGGYVVFAGNLMRLGGAVTLVLLSVLMIVLWRRERKKRSRLRAANTITGTMIS